MAGSLRVGVGSPPLGRRSYRLGSRHQISKGIQDSVAILLGAGLASAAVDGCPCEAIALPSRKQVHVKVGDGVSVDLVVHLVGAQAGMKRLGDPIDVPPE